MKGPFQPCPACDSYPSSHVTDEACIIYCPNHACPLEPETRDKDWASAVKRWNSQEFDVVKEDIYAVRRNFQTVYDAGQALVSAIKSQCPELLSDGIIKVAIETWNEATVRCFSGYRR